VDKKSRNTSRTKLAGIGTAGTLATIAGAVALDEGVAHQRRMKKAKKERDARRQERAKVRQDKLSNLKVKAAQQNVSQLEKINEKNLSNRDKKIRRELINREKDIIKGAKPRTLTSIASKVGLKSIPGVGAFLSLFASTPAYRRGGNVNKKRR
jgi:hypothetical protein